MLDRHGTGVGGIRESGPDEHPQDLHSRDLGLPGSHRQDGETQDGERQGGDRRPGTQHEILERMGEFRIAWDTSPAAVLVTVGPDHVLVYQNAMSVTMFGVRRLGLPLTSSFPEIPAAALAEFDLVLTTGRPITVAHRLVGAPDVGGGEVHLRYAVAPLTTLGRGPAGLVVTAVDLTGEARAEVASNRARLLASLTERVSAAARPRAALDALTDVLVPEVADFAAVFVLPEPSPAAGGLSGEGWGGREPVAMSLSAALAHLGRPPTMLRRADGRRWDSVLASGRALVLPFEDGHLQQIAPHDETRTWLSSARARNLAVIPLVVAGTLAGAVVLLAAGDRPPYTQEDLHFLTDVAARSGAAIAQVRMHRRQVQVSQDLQRALLPAVPPSPAGLRIVARYVAGADDVDVGGDWWDVVQLDPQRVAVGVGDVCGRGIDAAVVMGHARAAMRAAALAGLTPGQVLDLLDVQLADLLCELPVTGGPQFATALHALVDLPGGRIRLASAGHLPALIHTPGSGTVRVTVPPGPPLGLRVPGYTEVVCELPVGSSMLLFTDGLVEDRTRDLEDGLQALAAALDRGAGLEAGDALDGILAELGGAPDHQHGRPADDVAVILLRHVASE